MTDDKIAEIRARHDAVHNVLRGASQMHADRGYLLTEVEKLTRERDEARAEVEKLRAALRWYADHRNHFPVLHHRMAGDPDPVAVFVEEPPIMSDGGRRAREALEAKS